MGILKICVHACLWDSHIEIELSLIGEFFTLLEFISYTLSVCSKS